MKFVYDWFIAPPAAIIDYVLLCALGFAALVPPVLAWHWTIKLIEPPTLTPLDFPGTPTRAISWIAATLVSIYVFLVCASAVYELPHMFYKILGPENSN